VPETRISDASYPRSRTYVNARLTSTITAAGSLASFLSSPTAGKEAGEFGSQRDTMRTGLILAAGEICGLR
jgi:hypothetical protein